MPTNQNSPTWLLQVQLVSTQLIVFMIVSSATNTYVVQMDKSAKPETFSSHHVWYSSTIASLHSGVREYGEDHDHEDRIIYNYGTAFHGFAARLSEEEAEKLEHAHGVVAVFPERIYHLHTTRSPMFLGLEPEDLAFRRPRRNKADQEVVVGVLDTGIWPDSQSFNDSGMAAPPSRWRGSCETGRGFSARHCNRKIVGARSFYRGYEAAVGAINEQVEYKSPRDQEGHGTHTASTVAGAPVPGASFLGYASGTARGIAHGVRIAVYKVCWAGGCFGSDILSAVDRAVADGVHVLSVSLGGGISSFYQDSLSVGAFGAMEMGVFVSCSAGNGGPQPVSLTNMSPWIATVGASTMDRSFPALVRLGSGKVVRGVSIYKGKRNLSTKKQYGVVYVGGGMNSTGPTPSSLCLEGSLDRHAVAGKIVICDRGVSPRVQKGQVVKDAGGVGLILANTAVNGDELVADSHLIPAVAIGAGAGKLIKRYAYHNPRATATLSILGTELGVRPAPVVAAFSSRGPNSLAPEILKPDMVAPGVDILAAWTGDAGPSGLDVDSRRVDFNIISGTSMSCPHVSGVAALIKARHPKWSPAAIKSALMTSAYVHDNTQLAIRDAATGLPSTSFDHGAGHIQPLKALDPGLVYDIKAQDYFDFLCRQDLTPAQLRVFSQRSNRSCRHGLSSSGDLNYPAISAVFSDKASVPALTLRRTVTNVGAAVSNYHAVLSAFKGAAVSVQPEKLHFSRRYQELSYEITVVTKSRQAAPEFGSLVWKDGIHRVRSPIIITWPK